MNTLKTNYAADLSQRCAAYIFALLLVALSSAYASQPTSGVSFAQVSFTDPAAPQKYSQYGQVSIDYTMLYGEGYINVERYENGKAAGWVVNNLPVIGGSALSGYSTMFDLGSTGFQSSLSAYVSFTLDKLADDSSLKIKYAVVSVSPGRVFCSSSQRNGEAQPAVRTCGNDGHSHHFWFSTEHRHHSDL